MSYGFSKGLHLPSFSMLATLLMGRSERLRAALSGSASSASSATGMASMERCEASSSSSL